MSATAPAASPARPGRPRDPGMDQRVYAAARQIYVERGWSGFGFGPVARAAGVGKNALYLRWASPADLLLDALVHRLRPYGDIDNADASLRDQLVAFATQLLCDYSGPAGLAPLRIFVEASVHTEIFAAFRERLLEPSVRAARALVERAIERGEVTGDVDPVMLLDLVHGAAMSHAVLRPAELGPLSAEAAHAYAVRIVDAALPR
jgi:AcrR family transcriptional regulator